MFKSRRYIVEGADASTTSGNTGSMMSILSPAGVWCAEPLADQPLIQLGQFVAELTH